MVIDLDNSVHEAGVHVDNQHADECHFLPCILKDEVWIIGLTAEAVWSHHHSQVARVHLRDSCILSSRKHLQQQTYMFHREVGLSSF